jgi:peptidoglycan/LPS O-acetylase OafA/YrhL
MPREKIESRAQLSALTGLRFVAAAAVVAFHFVRWRFDSHGFLRQMLSCGFVAVGLFFVLSGFILVYAHGEIRMRDRQARREFWRARFARVYPLYALGMIFGACVTFWIGWNRPGEFQSVGGVLRLAAVTLMLTGVSVRTMFLFNWAAWSLTSELVFYFLFPLIVERLRRVSPNRLIVYASLATLYTLDVVAVYTKLDLDHLGRPLRLGDETVAFGHYLKFFPVMHLHEFLWGMTAGILWQRFNAYFKGISARALDAIVTACALIVIAVAMLGMGRLYVFLHSGLFAPLFAIVIVALASGKSTTARLLSLRPIVILGEASYAIYMLHVPLYLLMDKMLEHALTADARCLVYLATLLAISIAIHYAWERPLRRLIVRRRQPMT